MVTISVIVMVSLDSRKSNTRLLPDGLIVVETLMVFRILWAFLCLAARSLNLQGLSARCALFY